MNSADTPIILTGNQRSSTTFLATLLKRHPNGSFGTEDGVIRLALIWFYQLRENPEFLRYARFNEFIQTLRIRTKDHHKENSKIMKVLLLEMFSDGRLNKLVKSNDVQRFIRTICYSFYQKKFNSDRKLLFWGDKYPEYVMMLDEIHDVFPKAKYLFLIRHPLTNIEAIHRKTPAAIKQMGRIVSNLEECLFQYKNWHDKWQDFNAKLDSENYIELKFEDLIHNPSDYLRKIESYLKIDIMSKKYKDRMIDNLNPSKANYDFSIPIYQEILELIEKHDLKYLLDIYDYKLD